MRENGVAFRTDQLGRVSVKYSGAIIFPGVRVDGIFNTFMYHVDADDEGSMEPLTIRWHPPQGVHCIALDGDDNPVADTEIQLIAGTETHYSPIQRIPTNEDGEVIFQLYDPLAANDSSTGRRIFRVSPRLLSAYSPGVPFLPGDLPPEPIVISVPPHGEISTYLENLDGEIHQSERLLFVAFPVSSSVQGTLQDWYPSQMETNNSEWQESPMGSLNFPYVGLGESFVIRAYENDSLIAQAFVHGPTERNQVVTVPLRLGELKPTFTGRLVNEQGMVANQVEFEYFLDDISGAPVGIESGSFDTNEMGEFRFTPNIALEPGQQVSLTILIQPTRRKPLRGVQLDISAFLQAREQQLGDLIVAEPPVSISGTVVDQDGRAISDAYVSFLQEFDLDDFFGSTPMPSGPQSTATTDANGRFQMRMFESREEVQLSVEADGYSISRITVSPPALGLQIELAKAWVLTGSIGFEREDSSDLNISVISTNQDQEQQSWFARVRLNGSFIIEDGIPPGDYQLVIHDLMGAEHLFTLPPGGGTKDLGLIHFENDVRTISLNIKSEGDDLPWDIHALDKNGRRFGDFDDGVLTLKVAGLPGPIRVGGQGTRYTIVDRLQDGMEIVLKKGIPFQIEINTDLDLPSDCAILGFIENADAKKPYFSDFFVSTAPQGYLYYVPYPGLFEIRLEVRNMTGGFGDDPRGLSIPVTPKGSPIQVNIKETMAPQVIGLALSEEQVRDVKKRLVEARRLR